MPVCHRNGKDRFTAQGCLKFKNAHLNVCLSSTLGWLYGGDRVHKFEEPLYRSRKSLLLFGPPGERSLSLSFLTLLSLSLSLSLSLFLFHTLSLFLCLFF